LIEGLVGNVQRTWISLCPALEYMLRNSRLMIVAQ